MQRIEPQRFAPPLPLRIAFADLNQPVGGSIPLASSILPGAQADATAKT